MHFLFLLGIKKDISERLSEIEVYLRRVDGTRDFIL